MSRTVAIPWLWDRHSHVSLFAALPGCPSLDGLEPEAAMALLAGLPGDRVSAVTGWDDARLKLPRPVLATLPPAILATSNLRRFALTDAARRILEPDHPDLARAPGDPGWCERNLQCLQQLLGQAGRLTAAGLDRFMAGLQQAGIGAAEDLLLTGAGALRVIQASPWKDRIRCWAAPAIFRTLDAESREAVTGLKLFTDGALGARTAAQEGGYLDGTEGLLLHPGPELERELAALHPLGNPIAIHAIGGRAIEQVLVALEHLAKAGQTFPRVRMEHAQFITLSQAIRAKGLGVILSMQPNFSSDSVDYPDRLGPRDLEANNPFRMLIDQAGFTCGQDLILGSDGLPHGVEYAFQWTLFPPYPGQRLSPEELVAGYGLAPEGQGQAVLMVDEDRRAVRLLRSDGQAQR
jgi:hypothetical protein